ncbi:MAG: peptidoglycan DD-metalloendopeptidase family protein [Mangrovibacterium sp.]
MMVRLFPLVISLFFYIDTYAGQILPDTINVNTVSSEIDALLNFAEELPADSLKPEEGADEFFYKDCWNSTQIRYAQNMLPPREDTITITLVGPHDHPFVLPVKGKVISKFGRRGGRIHTGTDIKLNSGDTVRCAFDGRVRLAKRFSGYGNLVLVRHKNGLETIYGHLKDIKVNVNDTIKAGDLIGLGGRTGRATTDHLHFETRFLGEPFDSNKYIDFETFTLNCDKIYYKNRQFETDLANFKSKPVQTQSAMLAGTDGVNEHVICKGDNLWKIARRYNTTINKLCAANNIPPDKVLKIGAVLKIDQ